MGKKRTAKEMIDGGPDGGISASNDSAEGTLLETVRLPDDKFKNKFRDPSSQTSALFTVSQFEELHYTMTNLGFYLQQLIQKFQVLRNVDLSSCAKDPKLSVEAAKIQVKLAQQIVKAYWNGDLPLIDDILFAKESSERSELPMMRTFELRPQAIDQLQAAFVANASSALERSQKRVRGNDLSQMKKAVKSLQKLHLRSGMESVPGLEGRKDTDEADYDDADYDLSKWPPPLPEIRDADLLRQVFTHKSAIKLTVGLSKKEIQKLHYERLEFKGDAILDMIVAEMLYDALPDADEGKLTKAKSSLVCNDTLGDFAVEYDLASRLHASGEAEIIAQSNGQLGGLPTNPQHGSSEKRSKVIADLFEAYIGGVAIDRGYGVVQKWIYRLYEPLLIELCKENPEGELNKNAKTELYRKIGSAEQHITYDHKLSGSEYLVTCSVDGVVIGQGKDRSIKLAGLRAAMDALSKPKLVEKFAEKRRNMTRVAKHTGAVASGSF